jgi:2-polyprenyl-6-methoxyphenol hydroxylase-like FAD-dependent oxidoreductase
MSVELDGPVLISGGGPSGLAAAIMLHELGWDDITLVERRPESAPFDRSKAFNYQIDGRGQAMLARIGIAIPELETYGVANRKFVLNSIGPDGRVKSFSPPLVRPDKQTAYWITRTSLLDLLHQRLEQINTDNRIKLLNDHTVDRLSMEDGELSVRLLGGDGEAIRLSPRLVLGCDGVNSRVRECLQTIPNASGKSFEQVVTPSASSDLMYKVIRLPRNITVGGKTGLINDPAKAYVFHSAYKGPTERVSLFSLPVARPGESRTANIILPRNHSLWQIGRADELRDYLNTGFPQLDIDEVFPADELGEFLDLKTGKFPDPQYSTHVHAVLGDAQPASCVLLGDAAHAFPPDLGLGVNSALEDVRLLGAALEEATHGLSDAGDRFERERLPESRALVRLVRRVFPHQYNHVPWRFQLSLAKFLAQLGLSKLSFGLVDEPGFRLCQDERISYTECERRIRRTDLTLYTVMTATLAGLGGLATLALS